MLNFVLTNAEKWDMDYIEDINNTIKPNYMQRKALKELRRHRDMGVNKVLIVSAFNWCRGI